MFWDGEVTDKESRLGRSPSLEEAVFTGRLSWGIMIVAGPKRKLMGFDLMVETRYTLSYKCFDSPNSSMLCDN